MDGEEVLADYTTDGWTWVCTDRRILKYRKDGDGKITQLHDLSLDDITWVSLINKGENNRVLGYGVVAILLSVILSVVLIIAADFIVASFSLLPLMAGIYLIYRWLYSERAYFVFRGTGLAQIDEDQWQIDESSADNTDELREFVQTVRDQL